MSEQQNRQTSPNRAAEAAATAAAETLSPRALLELKAQAETVTTKAFSLAAKVPGWRRVARYARHEDDGGVSESHQLELAGPFNVHADPDGAAGSWSVEIFRVITATDIEPSIANRRRRAPLLESGIDIAVSVTDYSGDTDILEPPRPTVRHLYMSGPVSLDENLAVAIPPEAPVEGVQKMYGDHLFCLGWLRAVVDSAQTTPPAAG